MTIEMNGLDRVVAKHRGQIRETRRKWMRENVPGYREKESANTKRLRETVPGYAEKQRVAAKKWRANNPEKVLLAHARVRARNNGIEFSITVDDIIIPEYCPYLKIKINVNRDKVRKRNKAMPDAPSLDRIDNDKGYVPGNVEVISWRANMLKRNATFAELILMGEASAKRIKK